MWNFFILLRKYIWKGILLYFYLCRIIIWHFYLAVCVLLLKYFFHHGNRWIFTIWFIESMSLCWFLNTFAAAFTFCGSNHISQSCIQQYFEGFLFRYLISGVMFFSSMGVQKGIFQPHIKTFAPSVLLVSQCILTRSLSICLPLKVNYTFSQFVLGTNSVWNPKNKGKGVVLFPPDACAMKYFQKKEEKPLNPIFLHVNINVWKPLYQYFLH